MLGRDSLRSVDLSTVPTPELPVKLSVVVPCCDEADGLAELNRRLSEVCRAVVGDSYEIVLVNDGSVDETWSMMLRLTEVESHVIAVDLSRNYGHQLALTAGLTICRGDRALIIDADLQDPPELLPEMMRMMDTGVDVVYGQRRKRIGESWFKRTTAAGFYRLLERLIDVPIPRETGDFRLMSRRALRVLNEMPEQHRFIRGMVSWIGLRQVPILYDRHPRFAGTTKYPLGKMVLLALDAVTSFSTLPLRFASYLGFGFGVVGIVLLGYTIVGLFLERTVTGWASLMTTIVVLGSVQLVMLGIFGEYFARFYLEAKRRPLFVIDKIVVSADLAPTQEHRLERVTL